MLQRVRKVTLELSLATCNGEKRKIEEGERPKGRKNQRRRKMKVPVAMAD